MTMNVLEKDAITSSSDAPEISKEELCKKLCMNIFEGLLEGYEEMRTKNPQQAQSIENKICELKCEMDRHKALL